LENIYQADEEKLSKALHEVVAKKATIVLCSEKEEPAKTFRFLLKNPVIFQKFDYLLGYEWEKFIRVEAKKFGLNLRDTALRLLAEIYKENTWGLITEFQKLSTLKSGEISGEDLDKLGLEVSPNYWAMLDGLKSSNLAGRLVALEKLFGAEEPMPKVFNILSSQWREKTSLMAEYDLKVKSGKMDYEECLLDLVLG
jgi:DNA polymerase III delta subunit